jgi:hypothetical protein
MLANSRVVPVNALTLQRLNRMTRPPQSASSRFATGLWHPPTDDATKILERRGWQLARNEMDAKSSSCKVGTKERNAIPLF